MFKIVLNLPKRSALYYGWLVRNLNYSSRQFPKECSEEGRLAIRIATLFTEDLCQLRLDDLRFSLVITERDLYNKEEMTSKARDPEGIGEHESVPERPLFKTVAKQYYHAHVPRAQSMGGLLWRD